jgi:hypothetical protein
MCCELGLLLKRSVCVGGGPYKHVNIPIKDLERFPFSAPSGCRGQGAPEYRDSDGDFPKPKSKEVEKEIPFLFFRLPFLLLSHRPPFLTVLILRNAINMIYSSPPAHNFPN